MKKIAAALAAMLLMPAAVSWGADSFCVDPVHSTVVFHIKYLGAFPFEGRFNEMTGTIVFDEKKPNESRVDLVVKSASIDTGNETRDTHLKSEEYFHSEKHPGITFESDSVRKTGENTYEVKGRLTMLGKTRPLSVTARFEGRGRDVAGNLCTGFDTTFTVKRSDFGMTAGRPIVGDEVTLSISAVGTLVTAK